MKLPILKNHRSDEPPIGFAETDDRGIVISFLSGHELTRKQFWNTFGDANVEIFEVIQKRGHEYLIKKARILSFSVVSPAEK